MLALAKALRLPEVAYVGAMGSRRTHDERLARLREAGLEHVQISIQDADPVTAERIAKVAARVKARLAAPPLDLRAAPPMSAPGAPSSSMPGVNQNSAARVPRPPTTVSAGVLNGKAISLPKPAYPAIAKAAHVSGAVNVQVTVDENGNVISARAVSGHPLLRASAESAARQAKFSPTKLSGQQVKVTGVIVYNFVAQ